MAAGGLLQRYLQYKKHFRLCQILYLEVPLKNTYNRLLKYLKQFMICDMTSGNLSSGAFLKNFVDWFRLKPKLGIQKHKPPFVEEGDIWWCRFGENIGSEISGKGQEFARPCVIFTKLSSYSFLVIPTTTKLYHLDGTPKGGNRFVRFSQNKVVMLACLSQIRVVDYKRLKNKLGKLDQKDFDDIYISFKGLYTKK